MNRMNFKQQMKTGLVILTIMGAFGIIYKIPSLIRIGVMFYGFLFLMNPVTPSGGTTPKMRMQIRGMGAVVFFLGMLAKF